MSDFVLSVAGIVGALVFLGVAAVHMAIARGAADAARRTARVLEVSE